MEKLNDLKIGDECVVEVLKVKDGIKKRFLDIGLVKGSRISVVLVSPSLDMVAYLIKGAVVAIRKEDTKDILVRKIL